MWLSRLSCICTCNYRQSLSRIVHWSNANRLQEPAHLANTLADTHTYTHTRTHMFLHAGDPAMATISNTSKYEYMKIHVHVHVYLSSQSVRKKQSKKNSLEKYNACTCTCTLYVHVRIHMALTQLMQGKARGTLLGYIVHADTPMVDKLIHHSYM